MKFKISSTDAFGQAIADTLGDMSGDFNERVDKAVRDTALQAYEKLKDKAASKLYRTKDQYIQALKWDKVATGHYSIILSADAAHLEIGYDSYDMKKGLLHLGKEIPVGADGKPKIKVSKAGYRYRAIPFDHSAAPAASNHPMHNNIQGTFGPAMSGRNPATTTGQGSKGLKALIKGVPGWKGTTKDQLGNPIIGKVGTLSPHPENKNAMLYKATGSTDGPRSIPMGQGFHQNVQGISKYQYQVKNRNGGTTIKSAYTSFRIVSEDPKHAHKWIHPGFHGIRIFGEVQRWAEDVLARKVLEILEGDR